MQKQRRIRELVGGAWGNWWHVYSHLTWLLDHRRLYRPTWEGANAYYAEIEELVAYAWKRANWPLSYA